MRFAVKHMVWLSLSLYLLSGLGSAIGAFWCISGKEACGPGQLCAIRCLPHTGAKAMLTSAGTLLDESSCGPCLDIDLWLPPFKSRVRPLRTPSDQPIYLPEIRSVSAAAIPGTLALSLDSAASGPLLAQLYLRSVVMLN